MKRVAQWVRENRQSARAAFALRTVCMVLNALLGLLWTRWLLRAFGQTNYGLYMSFFGFLGLASVGELGMGGAVALRTTQLIAAGELDELRRFHGTARRLFLHLACLVTTVALALSPWLPRWLGFQPNPAAGSLAALFCVGAASIGIVIYSSYLNNSAYAVGSVMWPIVPSFFLGQATVAVQWALGSVGYPLWLVQCAVVSVSLAGFWISFIIYRHSLPTYAERLPAPPAAEAKLGGLAITTFWSYLVGLASLVYTFTDRLIVNALLGPGAVPVLLLNSKLCELGSNLIITASAVAMPALITRLLQSDEAVRSEAKAAAWKLGRLQGLLGIAAALGYLWVNDWFVFHMYGRSILAPGQLEEALATSLLVGTNLDVYVQVSGRMDQGGLRFTALMVAGSALLNFGFSILAAAWLHWLPGVAWATCLAQASLLVVLGRYLQRHSLFQGRRAFLASFVWPLLFLGAGMAVRRCLAPSTSWAMCETGAIYLGMLGLYMWVVGPGWRDLRAEAGLVLRRFGLVWPRRTLLENPAE